MNSEKNRKNKIPHILTGILIAAGIGATGVGIANAATPTNSTNPMTTIVEKISTKFNINKDDVQKVFDEQRAEMETQRAQAQTDRLNQAVKDGELTQDQATLIQAKQKELEASRPTVDPAAQGTKTDAEGKTERAAMKTKMDELKKWATDNNIPTKYITPEGGKMGMHRGMPGGAGMKGDVKGNK